MFVTSCEAGPEAWTDHEEALKFFHGLSSGIYKLVDNAEAADIILIGNVREENWGQKILRHPLINRWPEKCFSLSDQDHPLILNRGIYASGKKSPFNAGRVRSGSYSAYPKKFQNPFEQAHQPVAEDGNTKIHLFSFIGRNSHAVRTRLFGMTFTRPDIAIENSANFDLWDGSDSPAKTDRQKYYFETLIRSKFALCPRGAGTSSLRLFEALRLGIAPVIVSDQWIFPEGPRWQDFAIVVEEKRIHEIEAIVMEREQDHERMGRLARECHLEFFADGNYFDYVVGQCLEMKRLQRIPEAVFWKLNPALILLRKVSRRLRGA